MPDTVTNGYANGNGHMPYDMEDGSSFLFTSESVGEGHPGKNRMFVLVVAMTVVCFGSTRKMGPTPFLT